MVLNKVGTEASSNEQIIVYSFYRINYRQLKKASYLLNLFDNQKNSRKNNSMLGHYKLLAIEQIQTTYLLLYNFKEKMVATSEGYICKISKFLPEINKEVNCYEQKHLFKPSSASMGIIVLLRVEQDRIFSVEFSIKGKIIQMIVIKELALNFSLNKENQQEIYSLREKKKLFGKQSYEGVASDYKIEVIQLEPRYSQITYKKKFIVFAFKVLYQKENKVDLYYIYDESVDRLEAFITSYTKSYIGNKDLNFRIKSLEILRSLQFKELTNKNIKKKNSQEPNSKNIYFAVSGNEHTFVRRNYNNALDAIYRQDGDYFMSIKKLKKRIQSFVFLNKYSKNPIIILFDGSKVAYSVRITKNHITVPRNICIQSEKSKRNKPEYIFQQMSAKYIQMGNRVYRPGYGQIYFYYNLNKKQFEEIQGYKAILTKPKNNTLVKEYEIVKPFHATKGIAYLQTNSIFKFENEIKQQDWKLPDLEPPEEGLKWIEQNSIFKLEHNIIIKYLSAVDAENKRKNCYLFFYWGASSEIDEKKIPSKMDLIFRKEITNLTSYDSQLELAYIVPIKFNMYTKNYLFNVILYVSSSTHNSFLLKCILTPKNSNCFETLHMENTYKMRNFKLDFFNVREQNWQMKELKVVFFNIFNVPIVYESDYLPLMPKLKDLEKQQMRRLDISSQQIFSSSSLRFIEFYGHLQGFKNEPFNGENVFLLMAELTLEMGKRKQLVLLSWNQKMNLLESKWILPLDSFSKPEIIKLENSFLILEKELEKSETLIYYKRTAVVYKSRFENSLTFEIVFDPLNKVKIILDILESQRNNLVVLLCEGFDSRRFFILLEISISNNTVDQVRYVTEGEINVDQIHSVSVHSDSIALMCSSSKQNSKNILRDFVNIEIGAEFHLTFASNKITTYPTKQTINYNLNLQVPGSKEHQPNEVKHLTGNTKLILEWVNQLNLEIEVLKSPVNSELRKFRVDKTVNKKAYRDKKYWTVALDDLVKLKNPLVDIELNLHYDKMKNIGPYDDRKNVFESRVSIPKEFRYLPSEHANKVKNSFGTYLLHKTENFSQIEDFQSGTTWCGLTEEYSELNNFNQMTAKMRILGEKFTQKFTDSDGLFNPLSNRLPTYTMLSRCTYDFQEFFNSKSNYIAYYSRSCIRTDGTVFVAITYLEPEKKQEILKNEHFYRLTELMHSLNLEDIKLHKLFSFRAYLDLNYGDSVRYSNLETLKMIILDSIVLTGGINSQMKLSLNEHTNLKMYSRPLTKTLYFRDRVVDYNAVNLKYDRWELRNSTAGLYIMFSFLLAQKNVVQYRIMNVKSSEDYTYGLRIFQVYTFEVDFRGEDGLKHMIGNRNSLVKTTTLPRTEEDVSINYRFLTVVATDTTFSYMSILLIKFKDNQFEKLESSLQFKYSFRIRNVEGYKPVRIFFINEKTVVIQHEYKNYKQSSSKSKHLLIGYNIDSLTPDKNLKIIDFDFIVDDKALKFPNEMKTNKLKFWVSGDRKKSRIFIDVAFIQFYPNEKTHKLSTSPQVFFTKYSIKSNLKNEFVSAQDSTMADSPKSLLSRPQVWTLEVKPKTKWTIRDYTKISPSMDTVTFRGINNNLTIPLRYLISSHYDPKTRATVIKQRILIIIACAFFIAVLLLVRIIVKRARKMSSHSHQHYDESSVEDDFNTISQTLTGILERESIQFSNQNLEGGDSLDSRQHSKFNNENF